MRQGSVDADYSSSMPFPVTLHNLKIQPTLPISCTTCTACTAGPTQSPVSVMVLRYSPPGGSASPAPVLELPPIPLGHPALEALAAGLAAATASAPPALSASEGGEGTASTGGVAAEAAVLTQQVVPSTGLSVKQQMAAAVELVRGALAVGAGIELPTELQVRVQRGGGYVRGL